MDARLPSIPRQLPTSAKQLGVRLTCAALLAGMLLLTALSAGTTRAAPVGNCDTVAGYPAMQYGKIRWAGMSQCFAMDLEHGYTYTITVDAGDRSFASSNNVYDPLGDSVLLLYRAKVDRIQINAPYDAAYYDYVGMNDDYAVPAHLGSRMTVSVTGDANRSTRFIARVSGFNTAVGAYSISVTRSVQADPGACAHVFACP